MVGFGEVLLAQRVRDEERQQRLAAHRDTLARLTAPGGPIDATSPAATINNTEWYRPTTGLPRAARTRVLDRILNNYRNSKSNVRREKRAILLAGAPGSGKSTVLGKLLNDQHSTEAEWRVLDADGFKDHLLVQAISDGSIDTHLAPAEVRTAEDTGERVWPRERAALVHEESSQLMKRARDAAIGRGENVIIDGTMSNTESAKALVKRLEAAGYSMKIAVVDTSRDVTVARVEHRWAKGYQEAEAGTASDAIDRELGGRWVPDQVVAAMYEESETSVCRASAIAVADSCVAVDEIAVYRVDRADGAPVLVERRVGRRPDGKWKRINRLERPVAARAEKAPAGRERPETGDSGAGVARCTVCGRPLRSAASIARGAGPTCAGETAVHR